jgi:predicted dehydrogenase/threonine dehydrogenase-like Zn-dependent dehydrogenase
MLQVLQHQKSGEVIVEEIPSPECFPGGILVRTSHSLISAGTEKTSVENAKVSLLERAKRQPHEVKTVLDFIKREGILSTYKRVKNKLESYKSMGYSASGTVIESDCDEFAPGDRVTCAGQGYASHAGIISVPKNLAVKIPENVEFADAAYGTVGAIAMQGLRQADVRLGETVAVIGLGLIGQITAQLLKASGCTVIGMDINESLFEQSKKSGCDFVLKPDSSAKDAVESITGGIGADAVIITAGTSSNEPIELSLRICRKKGKVVIVGAVGMNVPRGPFYVNEIDLRISCSYGPGRYDPYYEELGQDYPPGYVRWTENRNIGSIISLIGQGRLDVKSLTTHVFDVSKAADAYDLITGKTGEPYLGILLEYGENASEQVKSVKAKNYKPVSGKLKTGFIGLGSFAQNHLLPPIKAKGCDLISVANSTAGNAKSNADLHGFREFTTDGREVIKSDAELIFCATRHDSHAGYVIDAIKAGKPIFVEKPLCISREELAEIRQAAAENDARVMVGFNRRFSKSFRAIKEQFSQKSEPLTILYRVNAGFIPKSHWVQQPAQGGRIVGEACHFIDCMVYLTGAVPVEVYAGAISSSAKEITDYDNVGITIKFSDGSVGTLLYLANGGKSLPKEYCEVSSAKKTAVMNNFEKVILHSSSGEKEISSGGAKGIKEEVTEVIDAVQSGKEMPIGFSEIIAVTEATFAALESLRKGIPVKIEL